MSCPELAPMLGHLLLVCELRQCDRLTLLAQSIAVSGVSVAMYLFVLLIDMKNLLPVLRCKPCLPVCNVRGYLHTQNLNSSFC